MERQFEDIGRLAGLLLSIQAVMDIIIIIIIEIFKVA